MGTSSDSSAAGLAIQPGEDPPSGAPSLGIREVQETLLDYYAELIDEKAVMQLLPNGFALEVRKAPEGTRFAITERLAGQYVGGPEPLRIALQAFVAGCRSKAVGRPQASSELSLFENDMPAVDRRFVGREDYLRQIAGNLLSSEPRSVVIRGVPGIGKTTLARKAIADPRLDELYNVAWVSCVDARTIDDLKRCLSRASQLFSHLRSPAAGCSTHLRRLTPADDPPTQVCGPLSKRLLIVLNRIEKLAGTYRQTSELAGFLPWLEEHIKFGQPRLLITMVGECDLGIDSLDIDLEPLGWREDEALFTLFRWTSRWRDASGLPSLVSRFAGHPLALTIAARAAPQNGDLETFVQLLQRHHSPEDDELDAAIKLLLLDSSLQDPKVRQLLRFVAYWPRKCELEVICAILDLPDVHTAILLADPASKLGILEFRDEPPHMIWPGLFYRMPEPFKDRFNRINPVSEYEARRTRNFVFKQAFHAPEWKHWANNPRPARFEDLDPLFLDAFQSIDPAVGTAALDAVLSIPRKWNVELVHNGDLPHCTYYSHQLLSDTLGQASDCARRLGYPIRQASLELVAAEQEISHYYWAQRHARRAESASKLEADLRGTFETLLKRPDADAKLGRRKCCYILGYLALWNACHMGGAERSSYLKQARQYLYMEDLEFAPDALLDLEGQHLSVRPVDALLDTVGIHLLHFHLHLQCNALDDAYHSYLAALGPLDTALAVDLHQCASSRYRFRIRLDVAALFAVRGALDSASKAVDLALPSSPLPNTWPPHLGDGRAHVHSATLFRHYLMDHKDARSWRQHLLAGGGVGSYEWVPLFVGSPAPEHWLTLNNQLIIANCAEDAVLASTAYDQTEELYQTWLLAFYFWTPATVRERIFTSGVCYRLDVSFRTYRYGRPRSEDLAELRTSLPLPHDHDPASYHHCYAALSALVEADFARAASAFVALEAAYIQDISIPDDQASLRLGLYTGVSVFPLEVRLSVFKPLFRALAKDCLKRHNSASALIRDSDAPDDERLDEPVAIASERLRFYIQAFAFVLIWVASCLPEIGRAV